MIRYPQLLNELLRGGQVQLCKGGQDLVKEADTAQRGSERGDEFVGVGCRPDAAAAMVANACTRSSDGGQCMHTHRRE